MKNGISKIKKLLNMNRIMMNSGWYVAENKKANEDHNRKSRRTLGKNMKKKKPHKHQGYIHRIDNKGNHFKCQICGKNVILAWIVKKGDK